ncbi:transposase [Bradyrhizobium sp. WSM1253]|uniref:transposase n=1 Tax=Bradyrhizobium sp. WSM1253 TaxID=319003 RepID=UPI0002FD0D9C|nr:transposase [Bradyrhizobium sp. WSM1253]
MTDDMMSLRTLVEKIPDADLLREMIGFAVQRLMELEVGGQTGRPTREESRTPGPAQRLPRRTWETRAGAVELRIPQAAQGSYFPDVLEPRRTTRGSKCRQEPWSVGLVSNGGSGKAVPEPRSS